MFQSMTKLRISNCNFGGQDAWEHNGYPFNYPAAMPSAQDKRIQTLILKEVSVTPKPIIAFIGSPWFSNLKQLWIRNCSP